MSKVKEVKFKGVPFLKMIKKQKIVLSDTQRIVGWGMFDKVDKKMLNEHYNDSCFSFDLLESAKQFFESIHNVGFIRCYIPKDKIGPIIFVCDSDQLFSKRSKPIFYAIAPRVENEGSNDKK